jgi:hypothetical protein
MVSPCSGCLHKVAEISPISLSHLSFAAFVEERKAEKLPEVSVVSGMP